MNLAAGQRFGPYELLSPLKSGGMGDVWRAHDPRMRRDVALKFIRDDGGADPVLRRRFLDEARAAGALAHPNVLVVFDVGEQNGAPYLVTELLEGESLRERLARGRLPWVRAVAIGAQVASGLAAAHARGIIHRDLKPENLFLAGEGRAKILDFGIARLRRPEHEAHASTAVTAPGVLLGTIGYMSPEQLSGAPADERSDLFALGCVLHEMLTGERPFPGPTPWEMIHRELNEDPAPIPPALGVPDELANIVRRCLNKPPAERFQSAADLAFALESIPHAHAPHRATSRAPMARGVAWAAGAMAVGLATWMIAKPAPEPPRFQQLTYRRGTLENARFAPDGNSFVYVARWDAGPARAYLGRMDQPAAVPFELPDRVSLQSVSSRGDVALLLADTMLARVPISGGVPRELTGGVVSADWAPDGRQIAVVKNVAGEYRVEFPVGTVQLHTLSRMDWLRVSRDGRRLAYFSHRVTSETGGHVEWLEPGHAPVVISQDYTDVNGLAWSPDGREVWYTAAEVGGNRALWAAAPGHRPRVMYRMPGGLLLYDVLRNGTALVGRPDWRVAVFEQVGDASPTDHSWMAWTVCADLRGRDSVLVYDCSEGAGPSYQVGLLDLRRGLVKALGPGIAGGMSPDGQHVVSVVYTPVNRVQILPTGAGEPRMLDPGPLVSITFSDWLRDGRHVLLLADAPGDVNGWWVQSVDGGPPRRLPRGYTLTFGCDSPDGRELLGTRDGRVFAIDVASGAARPVPLLASDAIVSWETPTTVLVRDAAAIPARVSAVDLVSGRRRFVSTVGPRDATGLIALGTMFTTPAHDRWIYSATMSLSDLYLMKGIR